MKSKIFTFAILSTFTFNHSVFAEDKKQLDKLQVVNQSDDNEVTVKLLPENAQSIIDTPDVLKKIAGANVNRNGQLTGIAQYRGLSGSRVNVNIDGATMQESCSNSMDAAMSHVPASMVDAVILKRGIAPVSSAIESIGGSISVKAKDIQGNTNEFEFGGEASVGYSSVNSGTKASVLLSMASNIHDFYLGVDTEKGDSFEYADGINFNTEYDRDFYLMGYNFRGDNQQFSLKVNYNDTGHTGTPSLPMDIVYAEGGVISSDYRYELNDNSNIKASFSHQNTDHLMSNYLFRNTTGKKDSFTQVNSNSYGLILNSQQSIGKLSIGIEGDFTSHQADISSPDNPMFHIKNFDTKKYRNSVFFEIENEFNETFSLTSGIRYTQVDMSANDVSSSVAMMQNPMGNLHRILRDRFNATDKNTIDDNVDFALKLQQKINNNLSLEYGLAYKTRSPSYQERYLWLPLEATAGMADGLQYFGNLELNPEHATQFELGLNYNTDKLTFAPHVFYHQIIDYIQGTPTTSMPAPPNTLTFNNVDAKLYGADIEMAYQLTENLVINNITSYVRGLRRDIDDNLYRIAPLNTRIELAYSQNNWSLSSELVAYSAQNDVSITNKEQSTPGYGITNIAGTYSFNNTANIAIGVNNIFDKKYHEHLNGYNRNNLNTDIGFDSDNLQAYRLPGEGMNIYASLYLHW